MGLMRIRHTPKFNREYDWLWLVWHVWKINSEGTSVFWTANEFPTTTMVCSVQFLTTFSVSSSQKRRQLFSNSWFWEIWIFNRSKCWDLYWNCIQQKISPYNSSLFLPPFSPLRIMCVHMIGKKFKLETFLSFWLFRCEINLKKHM